MKKKTYKQMLNRIARATKRYQVEHLMREDAEDRAREALDKADEYAKRFREFGKNVETTEEVPEGGPVSIIKWNMKAEQFGQYVCLLPEEVYKNREDVKYIERSLAESIAKGLLETNMIQFIYRGPCGLDPLAEYATYAAKLYVIPWEQAPHKRNIQLIQMAEEWGNADRDSKAGAE